MAVLVNASLALELVVASEILTVVVCRGELVASSTKTLVVDTEE